MKILVTFRAERDHLDQIGRSAPGAHVVSSTVEADLVREAAEADVLYVGRFDERLFAAAPALRWIHSIGAGVDQILSPAVRASDVVVTASRGVGAEAVAQHALGLMLAFARELPLCIREQAARRWALVRGDELGERTLGIIGLGAIGSLLARYARALDMRVVGLRRTPSGPTDVVDVVLPPAELPLLLGSSDYVVILAPLTPETEGLIGERELRMMRADSVLINLGRGPIVRQPDLVRALREGWIAGAGLDVFDQEPLPPDSPFWSMPNVIITPHSAGSTRRYLDRALPVFCDNLRRYAAGEPLLDVVDKTRGY